jgi:hypothetical protein
MLLAAIAVTLGTTQAPAATAHSHRHARTSFTHGFDVSWPQCVGRSAYHMPPRSASYVILGLTDGSGHTVNPCLRSQLRWAKRTHTRVGAYLVPSYPSRRQRLVARSGAFGRCHHSVVCRLHNDGASQASDAIRTMRAAHVHSPMVWVDVEFRSTHPWTHNRHRNAAVLRGVVRGLRRHHVRFGVYTTSYMWHDLVGHYRLHAPNWLPSGRSRPRAAKRMCRQTATGGRTWLVQYTHALDEDLTCPVLNPVPGVHTSMWPYRETTLRLRSTGTAVSMVQGYLRTVRSGTYDVPTELAVSFWQTRNGLPVTGAITPVDWRAMGAYRRVGGHGFLLHRIVGRP